MASKIMVFPDPVLPVIRNSPDPMREKSTVVGDEYGPKASMRSRIGFIRRTPRFRCTP